jgi:hypothetical protein
MTLRARTENAGMSQTSRNGAGAAVDAKVVISDWREDYNLRRPHSALGMRTPAAFAMAWTATSSELTVAARPARGFLGARRDHRRTAFAAMPLGSRRRSCSPFTPEVSPGG